jgi:hypothetical protein
MPGLNLGVFLQDPLDEVTTSAAQVDGNTFARRQRLDKSGNLGE